MRHTLHATQMSFKKLARRLKINSMIYLSIAVIMSFSTAVFGQQENNDCSDILLKAQQELEAGRFTSCIDLLNPCINGLKKDQKYEAYRLKAISYMFLYNTEKLDVNVVSLLKAKPNYRDFPFFDPVSFTKILETYDVFSKFEVGIVAGFNINSVRLIKNYSVTRSNAEFQPRTGYQVGFSGEYFLRKKLSLQSGIMIEGLSYAREAKDVLDWNQKFDEKLRFISVPVTIRRELFYMKGWKMTGELGLQSQFLTSTNSNVILINNENKSKVQLTEDQSDVRNKNLLYGLAGFSAKHALGGGQISLNIRYTSGLNNVVNQDNRWSNTDFIFKAQYVDSDMTFNPLYISFGYHVTIPGMYSVKKK